MKYVRLLILIGVVSSIAHAARGDAFEDGLVAAKQGDYATAMAKWRPLADQGNALAQYNLGMMYAMGRGVTMDAAQAAQWYRLSALQGYADAQLNLGVLYNNGKGVPLNHTEALQWFQLAAAQGAAKAHFNLASMYAAGKGVPRDDVLAYVYYSLAENYGYDKAAGEAERSARALSPAQIAEAQTLTAHWRPGRPLPMKMAAAR